MLSVELQSDKAKIKAIGISGAIPRNLHIYAWDRKKGPK